MGSHCVPTTMARPKSESSILDNTVHTNSKKYEITVSEKFWLSLLTHNPMYAVFCSAYAALIFKKP